MKNILVLEKAEGVGRDCVLDCIRCPKPSKCSKGNFIWKKSDKIHTFIKPLVKIEGRCVDCAIWNLCMKDEITKKELFGLCSGNSEIFAWADEVPVWETCTHENTKIGDTVRLKSNTKIQQEIKYTTFAGLDGWDCIVRDADGDEYPATLSAFEINVNKEK